ncbi:MAG: hypothetical protein HY901_21775 [Deltaproteobacteria bacterium]|nr:hypothetical protein [Deltaproteobacteria bacterium]
MTLRFLCAAALAGASALACVPGKAGAASLSLPKGIVLGRTEAIDVTLRVDEQPGDEERPLHLAVNVGTFEAPVRLGPGVYRALYRPPSSALFPQMALIALWREGGPEAPVERLRLPLAGRARLPIGARPGTELTVRVDDYSFGPVVVGPSGVEEVPLLFLPGVEEAEVIARNHLGHISRRKIPVQVPDYNRLTAVVVPHAVRADGRSQARLEVFYDAPAKLSPADLHVAASVGTASLQESRGGHFRYAYTPPAEPKVDSAELTVSVRGDPTSRASLNVALLLPSPSRLTVHFPATPMPADGLASTPIEVRLFDERGLGLSGHPVRLRVEGSAIPLLDEGEGLYRASVTAPLQLPPSRSLALEASLQTAAGTLTARSELKLVESTAPASLRVEMRPGLIPADGRAGPRLAFEVRDNVGRPVTGASFRTVISHGELGPVQDKGGGLYEVAYRPPAQPPPGEVTLRIADQRGALEQATSIKLRPDPGRLLLGIRAGYFHSLSSQHGPRAGLGATWRLHPLPLLLEAQASVGQARLQVDGAHLTSESRALLVPIIVRGSVELFATPEWSIAAGAGGVLAWSHVANTLAGSSSHVGFGAMAFGTVARQFGPGQAFVDLSYAWAPVRAPTFHLQAGGLGLEAGYRVRVF